MCNQIPYYKLCQRTTLKFDIRLYAKHGSQPLFIIIVQCFTYTYDCRLHHERVWCFFFFFFSSSSSSSLSIKNTNFIQKYYLGSLIIDFLFSGLCTVI